MIGVVTSPFVSLRGIVVRTNVPRQPRARLAINPVSQNPVVSYVYCTFIANRLTIDGSGYNCLSTSNCNTHQNLAQSEHRGTMLRFLILIVRGILIDLTRRKKRAERAKHTRKTKKRAKRGESHEEKKQAERAAGSCPPRAPCGLLHVHYWPCSTEE